MKEMSMPPQRPRPLGITIIAIVVGIQAIFTLIAGLQFGGAITLILGGLSLVLGRGLWKPQPWAVWTAVVPQIIAIINHPPGLRSGHGAGSGVIFSSLLLVYLC